MRFADTIYGLSSGKLPSGVAVVRISGFHVREIARLLFQSEIGIRKAEYRPIYDVSGNLIDRGIVLFFEGPRSFTGEDCLELHVHGGLAVVEALFSVLGNLDDVRPALAGEFTHRAFLNGKLDLTECEAIADLIGSQTEMQRSLAIANMGGGQSLLYSGWRSDLVQIRASIEADLDFSDESDVPDTVSGSIWKLAEEVKQQIDEHAAQFSRSEIIRDGFRVVLAGAPNVGKSSLLNALANREAAIVTNYPGTTRDPVEVYMSLEGCQIIFTDTAGIRSTTDPIEKIGIERGIEKVRISHLVLILHDLSNMDHVLEEQQYFSDKKILNIGTKCDLSDGNSFYAHDYVISVKTGEGLEDLVDGIGLIAREASGITERILPTRHRHLIHLKQASEHLTYALSHTDMSLELRAEDLRLACEALSCLTGSIHTEDLLDSIFSQFCIGK